MGDAISKNVGNIINMEYSVDIDLTQIHLVRLNIS